MQIFAHGRANEPTKFDYDLSTKGDLSGVSCREMDSIDGTQVASAGDGRYE